MAHWLSQVVKQPKAGRTITVLYTQRTMMASKTGVVVIYCRIRYIWKWNNACYFLLARIKFSHQWCINHIWIL